MPRAVVTVLSKGEATKQKRQRRDKIQVLGEESRARKASWETCAGKSACSLLRSIASAQLQHTSTLAGDNRDDIFVPRSPTACPNIFAEQTKKSCVCLVGCFCDLICSINPSPYLSLSVFLYLPQQRRRHAGIQGLGLRACVVRPGPSPRCVSGCLSADNALTTKRNPNQSQPMRVCVCVRLSVRLQSGMECFAVPAVSRCATHTHTAF